MHKKKELQMVQPKAAHAKKKMSAHVQKKQMIFRIRRFWNLYFEFCI